jgi:hypothetical protein
MSTLDLSQVPHLAERKRVLALLDQRELTFYVVMIDLGHRIDG